MSPERRRPPALERVEARETATNPNYTIDRLSKAIRHRQEMIEQWIDRYMPGVIQPEPGSGLRLAGCLHCGQGLAELDPGHELAWCPTCRVSCELREYFERVGWPYPPEWMLGREEGPKEPARADLQTLWVTYQHLLDRLTLSKEHRTELTGRRELSPESIARVGFKTSPQDSGTIVADIAKHLPEWPTVPGLVGPSPRLNCAPGGLLIPCRNFRGEIFALKRGATEAERAAGKPKYAFVSSASKGGPSALAMASLWLPPGWTYGIRKYPVVRITEGELKAAILAERTGIPTLSTPSGIGTLAADSVQDALLALRPRELLVCPDADVFAKPKLAEKLKESVSELIRLGRQVGFKVYLESWQTELAPELRHKGADDFLLAQPA